MFVLEALVVKELDVDILAGVPFTDSHDIIIRTSTRQLILNDGSIIEYNHKSKKDKVIPAIRRISHILRVPSKTTVWPGEFLELEAPHPFDNDTPIAIEPRYDMPETQSKDWIEPTITSTVEGMTRIANHTESPVVFKRNDMSFKVQF